MELFVPIKSYGEYHYLKQMQNLSDKKSRVVSRPSLEHCSKAFKKVQVKIQPIGISSFPMVIDNSLLVSHVREHFLRRVAFTLAH